MELLDIGHWRNFLLAFIPLFVAIDIIGVLPLFIALTQGMSEERRARVITQSAITALSVGLGFLFVGKFIFSLLGIEVYDFQVAGGLILLVFSIHDLLFGHRAQVPSTSTVGIVPLGIPLLVGPAVLTTILICVDVYGYLPTITSLLLNLLLVWVIFRRSVEVNNFMGEGGSMAFAKVSSVLLGAIAVMMIRKGIMGLVGGY
jgi:multiple antibiotic resistance protein